MVPRNRQRKPATHGRDALPVACPCHEWIRLRNRFIQRAGVLPLVGGAQGVFPRISCAHRCLRAHAVSEGPWVLSVSQRLGALQATAAGRWPWSPLVCLVSLSRTPAREVRQGGELRSLWAVKLGADCQPSRDVLSQLPRASHPARRAAGRCVRRSRCAIARLAAPITLRPATGFHINAAQGLGAAQSLLWLAWRGRGCPLWPAHDEYRVAPNN